jgi:diguanylate cyclase (GGDEF)-like protein
LALYLLYAVFKKDNNMLSKTKKIMKEAVAKLHLGYRITRGIDYKTLSAYMLKINRYKDIDDILIEASRCLKDILDYELFGFILKNGTSLDLWIEPRAHTTLFIEFLRKEFNSQIIDCNVHGFNEKTGENCHNCDTIDTSSIMSYQVMENNFISRLYILPRRNVRKCHSTIVNTIIGSISIALENTLNINQLKTAATVDPLTNCYNRRALDTLITSDIFYARRYGTALSVIMIDVDNFKKINDVHGHHAGDAVLKDICTLLPSLVRKSDYLARYGGEEFVLVLPDTSLYSAVRLAEKLRKKIEMHETRLSDKSIRVTASFGVASLENKQDGGSLLREADERLYKAKEIGKNRVVPDLLPCFADRTFMSKDHEHKYRNTVRVA